MGSELPKAHDRESKRGVMFKRLIGLSLIAFVGCTQSKPPVGEQQPVQESKPVVAQPAVQDELILYAIDGLVNEPPGGTVTDDKYFRGYVILGKVEITDAAVRHNIVKAIEDGFKESDGSVAACFWPRHGVQIVSKGKLVDYVICYECLHAHIFTDDGTSYKPTAAAHQAVLTAPLTAAGIKLTPSIEELRKQSRPAESNE